jgi:hypothetical protein
MRVGIRMITIPRQVAPAAGVSFSRKQLRYRRRERESRSLAGRPEGNRAVALRQACAQAGATHRVFLYSTAGTPYYLPDECAEVVKARTPGGGR